MVDIKGMSTFSLMPRRIVFVVGIAAACLSGCSTPVGSLARAPETSNRSGSRIEGNQAFVTVQPEASIYARRVADYRANPDFRASHARRILYVDALLHLGDARQAIQELADIEISFPDAYINAIYFGLAYEIMGDLKAARHWVSRSIERNVDARSGTEWLHLAMLDARLALAKDPLWLQKHSVLRNNTHRTAEQILSAIKIQLAVRGDFGLPADAVVSDLYFEAGICASSGAERQDFFAHSLEISTLRRPEIEKQERIRAKAHASARLD